jgi:hypothetical protein
MSREVDMDADPSATRLCGYILGYLFLVYLCMLNPLNGHLIVYPYI